MADDSPPKKKQGTGAPAWVMTFADLMSLLMCFFVLLLSFSEMDVSKYKQLAGSMANAFGVQRELKVKEPPKGINIIAREFSPGRPEPTPMNVIKQQTTNDMRINLDLGQKQQRAKSAFQDRDSAQAAASSEDPGEKRGQADKKKQEATQSEHDRAAEDAEQRAAVTLDDATVKEILDARAAQERRMRMAANARKISAELRDQIEEGSVDVETQGQKIIIRIREKASFGSGTAEVRSEFKPVLWRLGEIIETTQGRIVVAGHTDNVPIRTERYRSNWELSSARAVSVVHELLWQTAIPLPRFLVQGHGETLPIAPNDSQENRARNRRVEIILMQGEDREGDTEITQGGRKSKPVQEPGAAERDPAAGKGVSAPAPAQNSVEKATEADTVSVPSSAKSADKGKHKDATEPPETPGRAGAGTKTDPSRVTPGVTAVGVSAAAVRAAGPEKARAARVGAKPGPVVDEQPKQEESP
jgi:chemotaxis protein MotB